MCNLQLVCTLLRLWQLCDVLFGPGLRSLVSYSTLACALSRLQTRALARVRGPPADTRLTRKQPRSRTILWRQENTFIIINLISSMIDVCEAGGYQAYVSWTAPRQDLLAFRVLVERGRARARGALLGRAFGLPKELFCVVVSFWRTSRDAPDDFDDCPPFCAPTFRE